MKSTFLSRAAATVTAFVSLLAVAGAADCSKITKEVRKEIEASPTKVLVVVNEAISKNESCACEIVKTAIEATNATKQPKLVREIVVVAVTAAQKKASIIAECAVASAPGSTSEVKAALNQVFASREESAEASDEEEEEGDGEGEGEGDDFGPAPVVISGVYLIAPIAPSGGFQLSEAQRQALEQRNAAVIRRLQQVIRAGRRPGDAGTTRPTQS